MGRELDDKTPDPDVVEDWRKRAADYLDELKGAIEWNQKHAEWNRIAYRVLSVIAMVSAILAPMLVVSNRSAKGDGALAASLGPNTLSWLSITITFLLALTEGLRCIFRFDQRWAASNVIWQELMRIQRLYLDGCIGFVPGCPEWVKNYRESRNLVDQLLKTDTERFFQPILTDAERRAPH